MKLVIIGYSGAGKTTLANALSEALGCQVFHVDEAMYDNIRQREAPAAMAIAEARMEALWNGGWIIDGYREQCVKEAQRSGSNYISQFWKMDLFRAHCKTPDKGIFREGHQICAETYKAGPAG